jgi:nucleoside-specific outer membrane channel protein Tsx
VKGQVRISQKYNIIFPDANQTQLVSSKYINFLIRNKLGSDKLLNLKGTEKTKIFEIVRTRNIPTHQC